MNERCDIRLECLKLAQNAEDPFVDDGEKIPDLSSVLLRARAYIAFVENTEDFD